jgi:hypothetical protein
MISAAAIQDQSASSADKNAPYSNDVFQSSDAGFASFDIFEAFSRLDINRKLSLCDQLYHEGKLNFRKAVHAVWPQANDRDVAQLEQLIRNRINRQIQSA